LKKKFLKCVKCAFLFYDDEIFIMPLLQMLRMTVSESSNSKSQMTILFIQNFNYIRRHCWDIHSVLNFKDINHLHPGI